MVVKVDDMVVGWIWMAKRWREVIVLLPIPLPIWRCINAIRRLAAFRSYHPPTPRHGRRRDGYSGAFRYHARGLFRRFLVPRALSEEEVQGEYELNTGKVIIETLGECVEPLHTPHCRTKHGPFARGKDAHDAVHNAVGQGGSGANGVIARGGPGAESHRRLSDE